MRRSAAILCAALAVTGGVMYHWYDRSHASPPSTIQPVAVAPSTGRSDKPTPTLLAIPAPEIRPVATPAKKIEMPVAELTLPAIDLPPLALARAEPEPLALPSAPLAPLPEVKLPSIDLPKLDAPKVELPPLAPPKPVDPPGIDLPPVGLPSLDLPKAEALPKAELPPKVDLPKPELPPLDLPKVPASQSVEPPSIKPVEARPDPLVTPMPAPMRVEAPAPPPVRPQPPVRFISAREIAFRYEISSAGSSGIKGVELWSTENDGRTWDILAHQEGGESPIRAKLPGEGVYGFKLVVINGNNQRFGEPEAGEVPALRAELDLTLPRVKLFTPEKRRSELVLHWAAVDRNLFSPARGADETPFRLEWSSDNNRWVDLHAEGWFHPASMTQVGRPDEVRQEPVGHRAEYVWKVPSQIPTEVYLRLRVRDRAGNETVTRWPNRVSTDLAEPKGVVTELEMQKAAPVREDVWFPPNLELSPSGTRRGNTTTTEAGPMPRLRSDD